jgi:hypothetical protein
MWQLAIDREFANDRPARHKRMQLLANERRWYEAQKS